MKCLLVFAFLLVGSITWAQALPKGNVNISIIRSEVDKVTLEWKFTEVCRETLPFEATDARDNKPGLILHTDKCTFVENGVKYRVAAYYGALLTNIPLRPGAPKIDLLNFMGDIVIMADDGGVVPFPNVMAQSFATKDLAIKNAVLNVYGNQFVSCGQTPIEPIPNEPNAKKTSSQKDDNCNVPHPVAIQAVIEYEVH